MNPDDPPTLGAEDQERIASLWADLQTQQGNSISARQSITARTQALETLEPPQDAAPTGPASVDAGALKLVKLTGAIPDFTPTTLLGRGGMGEVHLAVDHGLRREVALKRASDGRSSSSNAILQEALFTGYLEHPNVVPVHRLGVDAEGFPVMAMKRVVGTSWRELLSDPEHPGWAGHSGDPLRANLEILSQVCNAVHFAHSRGILHRDIKPANVMVGEFGEVYLVDWGLAVRTDQLDRIPKATVGTLAYMAPEMLDEPCRLSPRTDVYLLGATLHEVLTGSPRHTGSASYNLMLKAFESTPVEFADDVPRELAELCNQATHKDPEARHPSALHLRRALEQFLEHRGSILLTEQAEERLLDLEREYADPQDTTGRRAANLLTECRFGFQQALQTWRENQPATAGLQRCIELAIERELSQGNHALVASLLPALPRPRPDLEQRLEALKTTIEDAPARLAALEQDLDFKVSARKRGISLILLTILVYGTGLGLFGLLEAGQVAFTYPLALGFLLFVAVTLLLNLIVGRHFLLANEANRKLIKMVAATWLALIFHVVVCWAYEVELWILITYAGAVMTISGMHMAVVLDRRIWIATGMGAAATLSGFYTPLNPLVVHIVAGFSIFGVLAWIWLREPKQKGLG